MFCQCIQWIFILWITTIICANTAAAASPLYTLFRNDKILRYSSLSLSTALSIYLDEFMHPYIIATCYNSVYISLRIHIYVHRPIERLFKDIYRRINYISLSKFPFIFPHLPTDCYIRLHIWCYFGHSCSFSSASILVNLAILSIGFAVSCSVSLSQLVGMHVWIHGRDGNRTVKWAHKNNFSFFRRCYRISILSFG